MTESYILRLVILFKFFCIGLAIWLSTNELRKYYANNDISTISYRRFEETSKDVYPCFSICFVDDSSGGLLFDTRALNDAMGSPIPQSTLDELVVDGVQMLYARFLFGLTQIWKDSNIDSKVLQNIDIKNITAIKKAFKTAYLESITGQSFQWKAGDENGENSFFLQLSYQDMSQVCFTRKTNFKEKYIRKIELFALDDAWLQNQFSEPIISNSVSNPGINFQPTTTPSIIPPNGRVDIYLHHPGQLMRSFGREAMKIEIKETQNNNYGDGVMFEIDFVSLLRKRAGAKSPCNQGLDDEDSKIRQTMMEVIGCVPIYWVPFTDPSLGLTKCNSSKQYQEFFEFLDINSNYGFVDNRFGKISTLMGDELPPCNEMTLFFKRHNGNYWYESNLILKFDYRLDKYQEIRNKRDWDIENVWSASGGFIGMFLGMSLFQVPDLLDALYKWLRTRVCRRNHSKINVIP